MKRWIIVVFMGLAGLSFAPDKPAYRIFDAEGKKVRYAKMLKTLVKADMILFGELHNDPIAHWLQFELCRDLHALKGDSLVLGAEMFESDNQLGIDGTCLRISVSFGGLYQPSIPRLAID